MPFTAADTVAVMSEQTDHYFTAEPASAAERRTIEVTLAGHRSRCRRAPGVFCPDRLDVGTAVLLAARARPAAHRRPARPRLRLGADRADPRRCAPRGATVWARRRQPSGRWTSPGATPPRWGSTDCDACAPDERAGRPAVRHDLVQPADPGRQGGAARPAAHLAAPPGRRRGRLPRRAEQPGLGLAAAAMKRLQKTPVENPSFDQAVDYFNSIVARVAASRRLVKFQRPCMAVRRRGRDREVGFGRKLIGPPTGRLEARASATPGYSEAIKRPTAPQGHEE